MNAQQFKELHLIYDAVYDSELREEVDDYNNAVYTEDIVEVATEYFYSYGLNSDGIDILVEKVGLESFVEFVYDLSEDLHVLTEARAAKKRTGGESYADVKAKIDAKEAAKKKAKEAGAKKKSETSGPESEAKKEQPKSKAPVRDAIARGIFRAVDAYKAGVERHKAATQKAGDAYRAGVEKHSAATATAGKLAKETGKTVGKAAQVAGHLAKSVGSGVGIAAKAGKKLVPEEVELDENRMASRMEKMPTSPAKVGKGTHSIKDLPRLKEPSPEEKAKARKALKLGEAVDIYDIILSHLLDEGYAESVEEAEVIMVNMSEEWREEIVEAAKDQSDKQIERGVKTTYKAGNVLDNQHQGRSRGLNRLPRGEREAKTERMRGRLKARRDDLFGERNKREDEARAEMKKKYGI